MKFMNSIVSLKLFTNCSSVYTFGDGGSAGVTDLLLHAVMGVTLKSTICRYSIPGAKIKFYASIYKTTVMKIQNYKTAYLVKLTKRNKQ